MGNPAAAEKEEAVSAESPIQTNLTLSFSSKMADQIGEKRSAAAVASAAAAAAARRKRRRAIVRRTHSPAKFSVCFNG